MPAPGTYLRASFSLASCAMWYSPVPVGRRIRSRRRRRGRQGAGTTISQTDRSSCCRRPRTMDDRTHRRTDAIRSRRAFPTLCKYDLGRSSNPECPMCSARWHRRCVRNTVRETRSLLCRDPGHSGARKFSIKFFALLVGLSVQEKPFSRRR